LQETEEVKALKKEGETGEKWRKKGIGSVAEEKEFKCRRKCFPGLRSVNLKVRVLFSAEI
jgi:hypothetical protein